MGLRSRKSKSLTLIELAISIAIMGLMGVVIYFSLGSAMQTYKVSQSELALQKVLSQVMEKITGDIYHFGLRNSFEIVTAKLWEVEFVPPWIDNTHTVVKEGYIYTLNRKVKPGASVPLGEVKVGSSKKYRIIPLKLVNLEDSRISQVKIGTSLPTGRKLRFTFYPDPEETDVKRKIWWDKLSRDVYLQGKSGIENISKNIFDVEITNFELHYYDNKNKLIDEGKNVDPIHFPLITGVEIVLEAKVGDYTETILSFVALRNTPRKLGYFTLHKDMEIPIPDSQTIHSFILTNFSGVSNNDELILEAEPSKGKSWRVKVLFTKTGTFSSRIERYTIEYPSSHPIYSEYPKTAIDLGLNLLSLGVDGLYDYDDDEDVQDTVLLKGDVTLRVVRMDIEGAGLFVKP
jgi:hypothetical protein